MGFSIGTQSNEFIRIIGCLGPDNFLLTVSFLFDQFLDDVFDLNPVEIVTALFRW